MRTLPNPAGSARCVVARAGLLLAVAAVVAGCSTLPQEASGAPGVALHGVDGRAAGWLGDDRTIRLLTGQPVAYLADRSESPGVYRFDGRHIGWFSSGILRDSNGDGVCAVASLVASPQPARAVPTLEPAPEKILRDVEPPKPTFTRNWSPVNCADFLAEGRR